MFSGTVRFNLDPFDTAGGDAVIWATLEQIGMAVTIRGMAVRRLLLLFCFTCFNTCGVTLKRHLGHGGVCCVVCGTRDRDTDIGWLGSQHRGQASAILACCWKLNVWHNRV